MYSRALTSTEYSSRPHRSSPRLNIDPLLASPFDLVSLYANHRSRSCIHPTSLPYASNLDWLYFVETSSHEEEDIAIINWPC
ncbi:unnamed protein product [Nezara viridula]|uniref:Uncharacterized protein n=1 Tax=Nezara viridula TaxID=85310 RepID=A0A9P0MS08_NEZVI|nr:unnamed protein product [Nezara viridula]